MATGYRIGGADLDELYEMPHVEHLTRTNLSVRTEANIITSGRYRKNGQPIKTSMQKTLFGSGSFTNPYHTPNFLVNGVNQPLNEKGWSPFGYLLATLGVGEHELTESNGNVYLDGSELPYAPVANMIFCILSAGGGGGAGSALLYCSAGGGGGASAALSVGGANEASQCFYPIKFSVGAGGAGGAGGENGQAGGDTTITIRKQTDEGSNKGAVVEFTKTLRGGGGGNIDDGAGGAGGSYTGDWTETDVWTTNNFHSVLSGGAGGKKENNGNNSAISVSVGQTGIYYPSYMSGENPLQVRQGGASSGNNYGGGGGASGLADGAVANSKTSGVAGTLGAGGSGAGYTAFQRNAGGKGGDGVAYIYY